MASRRRNEGAKPRGDTWLSLLRAAEKLFAERGVDVVSLREVSAAAGQANNSAVGYHFGSREGLIGAILDRHSAPIYARYDAQLDLLERQGGGSLRVLLEMLLLPLIDKLDDEDGGWEFIAIAAQLSVSPTMPLAERSAEPAPVRRFSLALLPFVQAPTTLRLLRMQRVVNAIYASIANWRRLEMRGQAPAPRDVFVSDLLDSLEALVSHGPSSSTKQLIETLPVA